MIEVDFGRVHLLEIEFREFHEHQAQNGAPQAKLHIRRSDSEVGMVAAFHLGVRYGAKVSKHGWEDVFGGERHVLVGEIREFQ